MKKCPYCGKEIKADAQECEHCKKSLETVNAMTKAVAESVAPLADAVKTAGDKVKEVETSVKSIDERLKKLEAAPASTLKGAPAIVVPEVYKGYKLHEQGEELRYKFKAKKDWFKVLSQDEHFDGYVKFLIDFVKATVFKDHDAHRTLKALVQKTGLEEATGSAGGYLVPVEYQRDIIKLAREMSFALQKCTVIPMSSNSMKYPAEASLVSVYWVGEKTAPTKSDPSFGQVTLTAKKMMGLTNEIPSELLGDSLVDLPALLTEQFAYAIGQEYDNQVLNGTGDPVSGILTAAAGYSVVLGTGSSNFSAVTADTFRSMVRKLATPDAVNAEFIYSKDIQYYVDSLKDSQGRYIYRAPGDPAAPGKLWSRGVIESAQAPAEAASGASTAFAALAFLKLFLIGIRQGAMTLDVDPYYKFDSDQVRFRMINRAALAMARSTAFVRAITAA